MDDHVLHNTTPESWMFQREKNYLHARWLRVARLYHLAFWVLLGVVAGGLVTYGSQADSVRQTWLGLVISVLLVGATWAAAIGLLRSWNDMTEFAS